MLNFPFPKVLREELLLFGKLQYQGDGIDQLGQLDRQVGQCFAQAVEQLLTSSSHQADNIVAIGSHGQTVRHRPQLSHPFTLQIGDPNIIAAETGITTVADFRRKDMAYGGQGAPFAPAFHREFFTSTDEPRAVVNLGGIANITLLKPNQNTMGFDTGPANTLMDQWIQQHQGLSYDHNGQWAMSGDVIPQLLEELLKAPYFQTVAPKSTGCEYFNLDWLNGFLNFRYRAQDVQRTLLELTATTVANDIQRYMTSGSIYLCGGGAHNQAVLTRLQQLLAPISVETTDSLGVHPDWVEALAFAWFAHKTMRRESVDLSTITGAQRNTTLGGIYYP